VRRKLQGLRPREERPAQRTGYRPGQVVQFDWAEMPTRPRIGGWSVALESFLEGHVWVFDWLDSVSGECVYDNLRSGG
jgi:hypothetical protein